MPTFGITPVGGFPPATGDRFPRFIQFQQGGMDVGDTTVETVNLTGTATLSLSSDGGTLTIDVTGGDTSGFAVLVGGNVFTDSQTVTPVALVDGTTIAVDAAIANHFTLTLTGDHTLENPTNLHDGVILNFRVKQDGSGGHTLAFDTKYKWANGVPPTMAAGVGAVSYVSAQYFADDDAFVCGYILDLS